MAFSWDPQQTSASVLARAVHEGDLTAEKVARAYLSRVEMLNPHLNALISCDPESVLLQAQRIDARRASGETLGGLAGVPVALKDNLCVQDQITTCGSRMLRGYRPPFSATVVDRLIAADAIVIGKANMDEFAMGSSNETSFSGPVQNPWDTNRIPGGSSGGSAVAVAADLAPLSLGSDTGGSIRQPAALCGVMGLKPTYGRVSRFGLVAFASSLDQIGGFAHDPRDMALLLSVIAGTDPHDSTCVDQAVPDYLSTLDQPREKPLRIGVPREFFEQGLDAEVEAAVREALDVYRTQFQAELVEVSLPATKYAIPAYYVVAPAECSSNLSRYDGTLFGHRAENWDPADEAEATLPPLIRMMMASRSEGFGAEVKRRIMLGTFVLSAGYADQYYRQALRVRRLIRDDFDRAFQSCDLLAGPTSPTVAFKLGERTDDPVAMYLTDVYTTPANLAGIPGLSLPCGFSNEGLPIGLQLQGPAFSEELLLQTAAIYQRVTDWHSRRPTVTTS